MWSPRTHRLLVFGHFPGQRQHTQQTHNMANWRHHVHKQLPILFLFLGTHSFCHKQGTRPPMETAKGFTCMVSWEGIVNRSRPPPHQDWTAEGTKGTRLHGGLHTLFPRIESTCIRTFIFLLPSKTHGHDHLHLLLIFLSYKPYLSSKIQQKR